MAVVPIQSEAADNKKQKHKGFPENRVQIWGGFQENSVQERAEEGNGYKT